VSTSLNFPRAPWYSDKLADFRLSLNRAACHKCLRSVGGQVVGEL